MLFVAPFLLPTMFLYLLLLRHWRHIHQFRNIKHAYQYFLILVYIWDLSCAIQIHILAYNEQYWYIRDILVFSKYTYQNALFLYSYFLSLLPFSLFYSLPISFPRKQSSLVTVEPYHIYQQFNHCKYFVLFNEFKFWA